MKIDKLIYYLEIERECIKRNEYTECDRDCLNCDLVQDTDTLLAVYDTTIEILKELKNEV